jgi:hypothetical protein
MRLSKIGITLAASSAFALVAFTGSAVNEAAAQQASAQRAKVVVQVSESDPARWNLVLNNVRNLQSDLGPANVDVEVVAYGPGIGMLQANSAVATRIDEPARTR